MLYFLTLTLSIDLRDNIPLWKRFLDETGLDYFAYFIR